MVFNDLVTTSRFISIWLRSREAPVNITPGTDAYIGTMVLGHLIFARFLVGTVVISVNIDDIARIDQVPRTNASNGAGPQAAPAQAASVQEE